MDLLFSVLFAIIFYFFGESFGYGEVFIILMPFSILFLFLFSILFLFLIDLIGGQKIFIIILILLIILGFFRSVFNKNTQKKNIISTIQGDNLNDFKNLIYIFDKLQTHFQYFAYPYLEEINNLEKINIICSRCFQKRDSSLIKLITTKKWIASEPVYVKVFTILKTNQLNLLSDLKLEETILVINTFNDSDLIIANNEKKMGDFLQNPICKCLIYFMTEQWEKYERIDFDQNLLKNIFYQGDSQLRKKITEKIKISGRSDWLQVIFDTGKQNNIELMTDYDWQVIVDVLGTTHNDLEKWKLARQAPPFYSQQLLKQIQSLDFIKGEKSVEQNLLHLGKKVIDNPPDFPPWINNNSETVTIFGHTDSITSLVINREGTLLASGSRDKTIKLWKLPSGRLLHNITGHTDSITSLVMNRKGTLLASGSRDKTIKLWELPSGQLLHTITTDRITSLLVMNREGTLLASEGLDNTIKLWELPSGRLLHKITGHTDLIWSLVMNREGTLLASASGDETIKIWELPSGRLLHKITGHTDWITTLVMNREGTLFASEGLDNTIKLWELPSGQLLHTITGHTDSIRTLVMNRDGTLLASGSNDKTIKLWKLPSGGLLHTLTGHTDWITTLVMNREGTLLASGSNDKTIKIWELPSGRLLHTLTGHTDWISTLVMNREGTLLASHSTDISKHLPRSSINDKEGTLLASHSTDITIKLWKLYSLHLLPISKIVNYYDYIQDNLKRNDLNENQRNWFEFILALVNNYRSFEIDIEDAPIITEAGEFDIDIEG